MNTELSISPFTGNVFQRTVPARLQAARAAAVPEVKGKALPPGLERIIRPEAQIRWLLPSVANITPAYIEAVLRGAMAGNHVQQWELFDLMEDTWPRLCKNLNELKDDAVAYNWKLEPYAEEGMPPSASAVEKSKLVAAALRQMRPQADMDENGFDGTLYDILDAWAKGTSVLEMEWEQRDSGSLGTIIAPRATFWVHPQNYAWSAENRLGLVMTSQAQGFLGQRGPIDVAPFPDDKFLIAICKARSGHPLAGALLRPLAWWWCASNFSQEWFLNFAQIFGVPLRWANYDPNIPGLMEKVADMLENMGSSAWAAFPAGTTLELKEPMKAGTDNPQIAMIERADIQADLLILRQTLTSQIHESGGAYAAARVHAGGREKEVVGCASFAADVLNTQAIPAILMLNYGETSEAPRFCPEEKKIADYKLNAERDNILLAQGVAMPKQWFYDRHNIPLPQAGEETITGRVAAPPANNSDPNATDLNARSRCSHGALRAQQSGADEKLLENTLEQLTGVEARWLGGVKPFFRELLLKAKDASLTDADLVKAIEQSRKQIPELFAKLDGAALATALEKSLGAAVINGAVRGQMQRGSRSSLVTVHSSPEVTT